MEYEGINLFVFSDVYEPAEDSFLLLKYAKNLKGRILEIGCGSGLVSLVNAKKNPKNKVIGIDLNPNAVACSKQNARINKLNNVSFFQSDLFSKIPKNSKFDFILFNPPYLPTKKEDNIIGNLNLALDGGRSGRVVLDRFLKEFSFYLKPTGKLLLIQSSLNNLEKTTKVLNSNHFNTEILEIQSFFFEKLYVLKAVKSSAVD